MIQPLSGTYVEGFNRNQATPGADPDELAFRNWQIRREAARQQIRRLSRRELQVVQLVSSGLANKSIALELDISVKTIEKHRANASRKLGVGSTAEMVRLTVLADQELDVRNRLSVTERHGVYANAEDN